MKTLRIATTVGVLSILAILALFSESFWWFQKVDDWETAFTAWRQGRGSITTASLWATVHGALSVMGGILLCLTALKPFRSPAEYGLVLFGSCCLSACFCAIGDIPSGWWMLIESGRYIPLCYAAYLQPFLVGYLLAILCTPEPLIQSSRQPLLPFAKRRYCGQ